MYLRVYILYLEEFIRYCEAYIWQLTEAFSIHAKSGRLRRYISAIFFGFSAKFQAENAKSILHPSHRLRQHHLRWRQHHLRWRQHHFRWKQHHFLSIFTIFYRFSRFTHFCRDLHFVAIYALFPQFFFGKIAFTATSHVFCMYGKKIDRFRFLAKKGKHCIPSPSPTRPGRAFRGLP